MSAFVYTPIPRLSEVTLTRVERHFVFCKGCNQNTTVDFTYEMFECEGANKRIITYGEYRAEDGSLNYRAFVATCPRCGSREIARKQLKRTKHSSKHTCGEKCRKAVSEECACSCAGLNHGVDNRKHEKALTLF